MEKENWPNLPDLISESTSPQEFMKIVDGLVSDEEKRILGRSARTRIRDVILRTPLCHHSITQPFGLARFIGLACSIKNFNPEKPRVLNDREGKQVATLLKICLETRILDQVSGEGKFKVTSPQLAQALNSIRSRFVKSPFSPN